MNWLNYVHPLDRRKLFVEAEGEEGTAGGGKGKTSSKTDGNGKADYLTQEQVNAILATEKKDWQTRLNTEKKAREDFQKNYESMSSEFNEFKKLIEEAAAEEEGTQPNSPVTGDPEIDAWERELSIPPGIKDVNTYKLLKKQQLVQRRQLENVLKTVDTQNKSLGELQQLLSHERETRQMAEKARLEALKDAELSDALTKNRCIDIANGLKIFRDQIGLDTESGKFTFIRRDGTKASVLDGISAEIPSYLVEAESKSGGSGAPAGARQTVPTEAHLQTLEGRLAEAQKDAANHGNDTRAISMVMRLKREIAEVKKQRGITR